MEGGGLDLEPESQELYAGEVVGLDYYPLEEARLRMFGGSSMHWGGRCRELDPVNFQPLPHAPLSGWPIGKADLDPYQAETDAHPRPGPGVGCARSPDHPGRGALPPHPVPLQPADPLRREVPRRARGLAGDPCAVNANLVDLRLDDGARHDDRGASSARTPRTIPASRSRARAFALCLGGMENPRLLLNCASQIAERHRQRARHRSAGTSASTRTSASARPTSSGRSPRPRSGRCRRRPTPRPAPSWRSTRP